MNKFDYFNKKETCQICFESFVPKEPDEKVCPDCLPIKSDEF